MTAPKDTRINKEKLRLSGIFKQLPEDYKKTAEKLIDNAAFMSATLDDLQAYINENGCTETYQNGQNQFGKKKSSEVEVYNTMIKNYKSVIDTLIGLMPKQAGGGDDYDGFEDFVESRKD
jgi:hypothetical protein